MASSWADGKTASLNLAIGAEAVTPREFVCRAYKQERDVIYRYLVALYAIGLLSQRRRDASRAATLQ